MENEIVIGTDLNGKGEITLQAFDIVDIANVNINKNRAIGMINELASVFDIELVGLNDV